MATPVCPPWAPDVWALVAGMYWLYGCWKIHNHKHTLHCCTLRTPKLMLFLHGSSSKTSIYCRDLFAIFYVRVWMGVENWSIKQRRFLLFTTVCHMFFSTCSCLQSYVLPATLLHCKSFIRTIFIWPLIEKAVSYFFEMIPRFQSIFMIRDVFPRLFIVLVTSQVSYTFCVSFKQQQIPQMFHRKKACLQWENFSSCNFTFKICLLEKFFYFCTSCFSRVCGEYGFIRCMILYIHRSFIAFYWIITSLVNLFAWKK